MGRRRCYDDYHSSSYYHYYYSTGSTWTLAHRSRRHFSSPPAAHPPGGGGDPADGADDPPRTSKDSARWAKTVDSVSPFKLIFWLIPIHIHLQKKQTHTNNRERERSLPLSRRSARLLKALWRRERGLGSLSLSLHSPLALFFLVVQQLVLRSAVLATFTFHRLSTRRIEGIEEEEEMKATTSTLVSPDRSALTCVSTPPGPAWCVVAAGRPIGNERRRISAFARAPLRRGNATSPDICQRFLFLILRSFYSVVYGTTDRVY